ncbi:DUF11 domain-containing protein [Paenibacillus sp. HWE-109]|uniref:DUF11 domain-containing protein n=1 Tax=Paenibacillus sp. HWE-109 TaxID=1306526 RepID=UPI001EDE3416|nr:DUF11 domain-containing protein [Paenibacillus sp. HWE-109]UKS24268.1 DUF11 domain-containing protein [Paenibacillus sp. HWE-109]
MTAGSEPTNHLLNQSVVRFSSGQMTSHAYSNIVDTPVVGPIIMMLKKANTTEAAIGQIITYEISISNKGNLDAQVTLLDTLPEGTSFVPNSVIVAGVPVPMSRPDVGIAIGTLQVNQTVGVIFQIIVLEVPPTMQLKNQATTTYFFQTPGGREVTGSSRSNTVNIPFGGTKIRFIKQANKSYTFVGDTVTFEFRIKNEGEQPINKTVFKDELPSNTVFVPGSVKIGYVSYPSASPMDGIPLGSISPGAEDILQFQVSILSVPSTGMISNYAVLTFMDGDYSVRTNSNTSTLDVYDPAISLVESVLQPRATLGDTLTFTMIVANQGNIAAEIRLSDFVPEGSSYEVGSMTVDGVPYDQAYISSGIYLGVLQPREEYVVTYLATVNSVGLSVNQQLLISQATALYVFRLPDEQTISNRLLSNLVSVELLRPIMDVMITASPQRAEPGSIITYRIRVSNTGNLAATNVLLYDWISQLVNLVPGSLRINSSVISLLNVDQPLQLGVVLPDTTVELTYLAAIVHHSNTRRIPLRAAARYIFQVNAPIHSGTVLSNEVVVLLEHADE